MSIYDLYDDMKYEGHEVETDAVERRFAERIVCSARCNNSFNFQLSRSIAAVSRRRARALIIKPTFLPSKHS